MQLVSLHERHVQQAAEKKVEEPKVLAKLS